MSRQRKPPDPAKTKANEDLIRRLRDAGVADPPLVPPEVVEKAKAAFTQPGRRGSDGDK